MPVFIGGITLSLWLCFALQENTRFFCSSLKIGSQFASRSHLPSLHLFWIQFMFLKYGQLELYMVVDVKFLSTLYMGISVFSFQLKICHLRHSWTCQVSHTWQKSAPLPLFCWYLTHWNAAASFHRWFFTCTIQLLGISRIYSQPDATCDLTWPERQASSSGFRILRHRILTFTFILTIVSVVGIEGYCEVF